MKKQDIRTALISLLVFFGLGISVIVGVNVYFYVKSYYQDYKTEQELNEFRGIWVNDNSTNLYVDIYETYQEVYIEPCYTKCASTNVDPETEKIQSRIFLNRDPELVEIWTGLLLKNYDLTGDNNHSSVIHFVFDAESNTLIQEDCRYTYCITLRKK